MIWKRIVGYAVILIALTALSAVLQAGTPWSWTIFGASMVGLPAFVYFCTKLADLLVWCFYS